MLVTSSQLKTIEDSRKIRNRVLSNLELASLPTTTPEERQTLLSFVVCGGGPTGVEFASELYDMINEDVLDYVSSAYPIAFQDPPLISSSLVDLAFVSRSIQNCSENKLQSQSYSQEIISLIPTARPSLNTQKADSTDTAYTPS